MLVTQDIGLMSWVFANSPENLGFNPRSGHTKDSTNAALPNTQHYKVRIKDKVEQTREWSSALLYTSVL